MILGRQKLCLLNIIKQAIEDLNIGRVGLDMHVNTKPTKWFPNILCNSNYMSQMKHKVDEYDKKCTVAPGRIEPHKKR